MGFGFVLLLLLCGCAWGGEGLTGRSELPRPPPPPPPPSSRAIYTLVAGSPAYAPCALPLLREFARGQSAPFVEFRPPAGAGDDPHFAKLLLFRDALRAGYEEIAYVDVDIVPAVDVVNGSGRRRNLFEDAGLPASEPSIALYPQGAPKQAVFDAVKRINRRVQRASVQRSGLQYWNTGVVVVNRLGMFRVVAALERLRRQFVARNGPDAERSLPFFDQGFMNALLWDDRSGLTVRRLSFRWNTSHSKYFYHHGNRFWLDDPKEEQPFEPQLFHFMGCAGRNVTAVDGSQCKLKRIREFVREQRYPQKFQC